MVNRALHRVARLGWCLLASACLLAIAAAPARAAAPLMIWPVDPVIAGSQRAVALWIENRGLQPVTVQVRVMGWTQDQGDDQFASQKDVIASPPITDIAPGARQMVRLMAMGPAAPL
ncbi:MAG: molecular chaperone, partial [Comamonadaceae bacterium]